MLNNICTIIKIVPNNNKPQKTKAKVYFMNIE